MGESAKLKFKSQAMPVPPPGGQQLVDPKMLESVFDYVARVVTTAEQAVDKVKANVVRLMSKSTSIPAQETLVMVNEADALWTEAKEATAAAKAKIDEELKSDVKALRSVMSGM